MYVYEGFDPVSLLSLASGIGTELNFFVDLINFCVEYINADDVITLLYRILSLDQSLFEICNLKEEK